MIIFGVVFLHLVLSSGAAAAAAERQDELILIGEKGKSILLPCFGQLANRTLLVTRWKKDGQIAVTHEHSQPPSTGHFSVLDDGSLNITDLLTLDEGVYQCAPVSAENRSLSRSIALKVADGPNDVTADIRPATQLPNGTLYVQKGSNISLNCSSKSYPWQNLTWVFEEVKKASLTGPWLQFQKKNLQPADQGSYTCQAQNLLSNRTVEVTQELLVYYAPERHPNCSWEKAQRPDLVHFNCSWYGGYPTPLLQVFLGSQTGTVDKVINLKVTENLGVTLNRTWLYNGQKVTCKGHIEQLPGHEKTCSFILKEPYPIGDPLVSAVEGRNVTLSCSEEESLPPAKTVWQKGKNQEVIVPSSKYVVDVQGPKVTLTIVNVTKEDEGLFFCWSENVMAVKELEVYVTVRSSADSSGVVVGIFISVLIVAAGITLGLLAYSRRDRICLSFRLSGFEEDRTDVLSLVESDEDDVFHDAVPRLPPLSNGHGPTRATTLVEIHRIQSSDHEDNGNDTEQADQDQMKPDE
ncbi:V-set and immunoglobulin domain-containing protein 10 [Salminus brasiliensis]|uniref:V-set and immunoglobulin domain-containing protein 10 n=1 Tax=Salminus brasiliensis TaxID=930266 RepID=UPI003B834F5E